MCPRPEANGGQVQDLRLAGRIGRRPIAAAENMPFGAANSASTRRPLPRGIGTVELAARRRS
jgi:hypothetical protein